MRRLVSHAASVLQLLALGMVVAWATVALGIAWGILAAALAFVVVSLALS